MAGNMAVRAAKFLERVENKFLPRRPVAYFSMEYGIRRDVKIYGGGLGILAGDTIKSSADRGTPLVGLGLLYQEGYFCQQIINGRQESLADIWDHEHHPALVDTGKVVEIKMEGKSVSFRVWGMEVPGYGGDFTPLLLLDSTGVPNPLGFDDITNRLYNPEPWHRLTQEQALGIGGVRALGALGISPSLYHLNEGHAAFAVIEYLRGFGKNFENITPAEFAAARQMFGFTTHTPVNAGFDRFHRDLILKVFVSEFDRRAIFTLGMDPRNADYINMAYLAARGSRFINGVSQIHAAVSREVFAPLASDIDVAGIIGVTNGVHHLTWTSPHLAAVYDKYVPEWRSDPGRLKALRYQINNEEFRQEFLAAHQQAKRDLFKRLGREDFDSEVLTVGFARRFATYKRGDLLFADLEKLLELAEKSGSLQLVFAGKAHPADDGGRGIIQRVIHLGKEVEKRSGGKIKFIFVENYDMELGGLMTAGVDIWLNNPIPPYEASGTSGMKAALNGVPQLSTYDGWWPEGAHADMTGWTFGNTKLESVGEQGALYAEDSVSLYRMLDQIVSLFYAEKSEPRSAFVDKMIYAVALNGSYFNTNRMVSDYEELWGLRG